MGKSIIVAPAVVMVISAIRRDQFFDEFLQVFDETRFVFNGRERGGGPRYKYMDGAVANLSALDEFVYLGRDIDDVAETGSLLGKFICPNRDHASELSFEDPSFYLTDELLGSL